jgi:hypothetical protein
MNKTNHMNQINQINKTNQINQTNQMSQFHVSRAFILLRFLYGCNVLGRGIGVNSLKRGGSLFEGIAQRVREEYIIRTWSSEF